MKRPFFYRRLCTILVILTALVLLCSGCEKIQEKNLQKQLDQVQTLLEQEKEQEAQTLLEQLVKDAPKDSRAYGFLSDLYLSQNDWKSAQKILEQGIQNAKDPSSLKEKQQSLEKKIDTQNQAAAVLQPVITYWGDTYFWKYTAQGVEAQNSTPVYGISSGENQLIRQNSDGAETVLYTGPGGGNLLLFEEQIYFSAGEKGMGAVSIQGGEASFVENASPAGCDLSAGKLLFSSQSGSTPTIGAVGSDNKSVIIAQGRLLAVSGGRVYYQPPQQQGSLWLQLCSVNTDGSQDKALCQVLLDPGQGERSLHEVQVVENTIYFSFGMYHEDTGEFVHGGIAKVNDDGTGFKSLAQASSPLFLVYLDNGTPMLRYQSQESIPSGQGVPQGSSSCQSLNIETGDSAVSPMPCGPLGVPFTDGKGNLWIYPDLSGTPTQLLSTSEGFLSTGTLPSGIQQDNTSWKTVSQACISGDYLYFTAIESSYNYTGNSSYFLRDSSQVMRKSLSNGKAESLYSY